MNVISGMDAEEVLKQIFFNPNSPIISYKDKIIGSNIVSLLIADDNAISEDISNMLDCDSIVMYINGEDERSIVPDDNGKPIKEFSLRMQCVHSNPSKLILDWINSYACDAKMVKDNKEYKDGKLSCHFIAKQDYLFDYYAMATKVECTVPIEEGYSCFELRCEVSAREDMDFRIFTTMASLKNPDDEYYIEEYLYKLDNAPKLVNNITELT